MTRLFSLASAALILSAPVAMADGHAASGDPAAGAAVFAQCQTCHIVQNEDGEILAGRNARQGPNLHAIAGRPIGAIEGFRYSDGLTALNEMGVTWVEENFVAYVQNPTDYIRTATENRRFRGAMAFRVRSEEDALNLYAYLASFTAE